MYVPFDSLQTLNDVYSFHLLDPLLKYIQLQQYEKQTYETIALQQGQCQN